MITLFSYPASRNAWKVRLLLEHLGQPYRTVSVDIFNGEGRQSHYLRVNPTGKVPAILLEDGRTLTESNAILFYLANGSRFLPTEAFEQAKVLQWLSFEQEHLESKIGTLRYWMHAGDWSDRSPTLIENMRAAAQKGLCILNDRLTAQAFIASDRYSIADMALFAYATCAEDVGITLAPYPHFRDWIDRVQTQPGFLAAPA
jgi:glutathione S-transferase